MRILIAPAPYKECMDARLVADTIELGLGQVLPNATFDKLPLCDGGTGIVERLVEARGGSTVHCRVRDPLMNEIDSYFGVLSDGTGVVESAKAVGLALVPRDQRNPLVTSTFGVGELIRKAVDYGCTSLIVGCGDSATNDGGVGMARALGYSFKDANGAEVPEGGGSLAAIQTIDTDGVDPKFLATEIIVACNITSVLGGPTGTSLRYAKQKGASSEAVASLASNVELYADTLAAFVGWDLRHMPGTGAAGGLGAGLLAFLRAKLRYSMTLVCDALDVDSHLRSADMVITGEGMLDSSSTAKAACAIGLLAKKYNIPTVAVAGSIGDDADIVFFHGIDKVEICLKAPMSAVEAVEPEAARRRLLDASVRLGRAIKRNSLARTPAL